MFGIVDHRERADCAGAHAKELEQPVGTAEGQPVSPDLVLQRFQVDLAILLRNDQKIPFLAVTQIQILHMSAHHIAAMTLGLLDRAKRRMFVTGKGDAGIFQCLEQRFRGCGKRILEIRRGVHV